jgi:hypothetical protein
MLSIKSGERRAGNNRIQVPSFLKSSGGIGWAGFAKCPVRVRRRCFKDDLVRGSDLPIQNQPYLDQIGAHPQDVKAHRRQMRRH